MPLPTPSEILDAVDIRQVVSDGGVAMHLVAINDLRAKCPFDDDVPHSITINPVRRSWCCLECEVGGDIFAWIMMEKGFDFGQAHAFLATEYMQ